MPTRRSGFVLLPLTLALAAGMMLGGCFLPDSMRGQVATKGQVINVLGGAFVYVGVMAFFRLNAFVIVAGLLLLAACTVEAASMRPTERPILCEIESRTFRFPDTAVSPKGAVGYCQVLPETAAWVVRHAVNYGLLSGQFLPFQGMPEAWKWLLQVRFVNEAIADAYLIWIRKHRSRDLRTVLFKYHAGHDARMTRGTESWRHSNEVYRAIHPFTPPRAPGGKGAGRLVAER